MAEKPIEGNDDCSPFQARSHWLPDTRVPVLYGTRMVPRRRLAATATFVAHNNPPFFFSVGSAQDKMIIIIIIGISTSCRSSSSPPAYYVYCTVDRGRTTTGTSRVLYPYITKLRSYLLYGVPVCPPGTSCGGARPNRECCCCSYSLLPLQPNNDNLLQYSHPPSSTQVKKLGRLLKIAPRQHRGSSCASPASCALTLASLALPGSLHLVPHL